MNTKRIQRKGGGRGREKLLLKNLKTKEIFYAFFYSEDDTRGKKEGNRILEKADTGET